MNYLTPCKADQLPSNLPNAPVMQVAAVPTGSARLAKQAVTVAVTAYLNLASTRKTNKQARLRAAMKLPEVKQLVVALTSLGACQEVALIGATHFVSFCIYGSTNSIKPTNQ